MKIAVIGASGMVGSRVVHELSQRGHEVTGVTRSGTEVPEATSVRGDLGDAGFVRSLAADHDVVLSATGPSRTGEDHQIWLDALQTAQENATDTRLFVIGGAGSLLIEGTRLVDLPGFPEGYKAEALTATQALDNIRQAPESLDWTFLSPAPEIAPGERTGTYQVADDTPAGDKISAEDFAVAIVDELEQPKHRRARFTVAN
ncbi:putative epimerase/dehydratase [Flexivirga endophytica]|uniref:Epimerase/dehydratase n=1 Tax=Flexivirga endophytica TaxID=1849103 RepID=A0A916T5I2_9MICO|nr:NAD(P)H-binding protein [Flexivirga endophytica]GGB29377.1 putative epimerase/dehydratase [Flexivirga endophytica]GHB50474.1 putative epimerase/dehydratase [Flexivirga endophytica]